MFLAAHYVTASSSLVSTIARAFFFPARSTDTAGPRLLKRFHSRGFRLAVRLAAPIPLLLGCPRFHTEPASGLVCRVLGPTAMLLQCNPGTCGAKVARTLLNGGEICGGLVGGVARGTK
jgi:hypothetical protein